MDGVIILLSLILVALIVLIFYITKMRKDISRYDAEKRSNNIERSVNNNESTSVSEFSGEGKCKSSDNSKKKKHSKRTVRTTDRMRWKNKMLDITMIPRSVELDKETLLPLPLRRQYGYGKRFNAFVTPSDRVYYHKSSCNKLKSKNKQAIHRYWAVSKLNPCPICNPQSRIDDWYFDFLSTNFQEFNSYTEFRAWARLPLQYIDGTKSYIGISGTNKQLSLFDDTPDVLIYNEE